MGSAAGNDSRGNHVVLFPFMSKGHTIPLLHLARLLLRRPPVTAVTVFTTPANRHFIASSLSGTAASVVSIPFPQEIPGIDPSIESTDQLPLMSLFPAFASATAIIQPWFETELEKLLPVQLLISDGFLWWTLESASKLEIPRMAFHGMSNYTEAMRKALSEVKPPPEEADDGPFTVTALPWIKITRNDHESLPNPQWDAVYLELIMKMTESTINSYGLLVNSFEELEPAFLDYLNRDPQPQAWCVGPLCLADQPEPVPDLDKPAWARWLDRKQEERTAVLYVAFGSQGEISAQQLKEIAVGLEKSEAHFLWVIKKKESGLGDGFEEGVKARGLVVRDWVDQRSILLHPRLQGFLSHCGWNSVLESICTGVPVLAWPMIAEQPLNAKMVEEELGIGLRVDGPPFKGKGGLVMWDEVERKVPELMEGERGKEAGRKVRDVADVARQAVEEGGSSWQTLNSLLRETCKCK